MAAPASGRLFSALHIYTSFARYQLPFEWVSQVETGTRAVAEIDLRRLIGTRLDRLSIPDEIRKRQGMPEATTRYSDHVQTNLDLTNGLVSFQSTTALAGHLPSVTDLDRVLADLGIARLPGPHFTNSIGIHSESSSPTALQLAKFMTAWVDTLKKRWPHYELKGPKIDQYGPENPPAVGRMTCTFHADVDIELELRPLWNVNPPFRKYPDCFLVGNPFERGAALLFQPRTAEAATMEGWAGLRNTVAGLEELMLAPPFNLKFGRPSLQFQFPGGVAADESFYPLLGMNQDGHFIGEWFHGCA